MIDVDTEDLIDLREAARHRAFRQRNGKAAHFSSIYRWISRGARARNGARVVLETIKLPIGLRTTTQAITRFIDALTNPGNTSPAPTSATRRRQMQQTHKELTDAGML
jgi:hypothetical protein